MQRGKTREQAMADGFAHLAQYALETGDGLISE
jgi:hypothetical protein